MKQRKKRALLECPPEALPVVAMTAAARNEGPRRRSPVVDFLDNPDGGAVFHPITQNGDES
jgi:hypothetical protein